MTQRILIAGASARAAAHSAVRAGFRPMAIDLFADRDLGAWPAIRIGPRDYPRRIPALAEAMPPGPFIYTGGLENHPRVLSALGRSRQLWGNPAAVVRRARDPLTLHAVLLAAGLRSPRCLPPGCPPARGRRWLRKPLRGSGGRGIRPAAGNERPDRRHYLQEWIEGVPCAALYLGFTGGALHLGLTRQLVGEPALGAGPFAYSGSIGPLRPGADVESRLETLGQVLAGAFGLRGLFGADLVMRDGEPWTIEVNPRYTASVEVLELAAGFSALSLHAAACRGEPLPVSEVRKVQSASDDRVRGKAIVFARRDGIAPATWGVAAADLPHAGETVRSGRPLLTVFAGGPAPGACRRALFRAAAEVHRRFRARPAARALPVVR